MSKEKYNQYNKEDETRDIISHVPNNLTVSFNTHCNPTNKIHGNFTLKKANEI